MIKRLLRRWLDVSQPEDGLAETLAITVRCARRCAYDLAHAADFVRDPQWERIYVERATHWQRLFSSGASMKDYRLRLHSQIDEQEVLIERLRAALKVATGSEYLPDEVPF